jgi:hypothetical protein
MKTWRSFRSNPLSSRIDAFFERRARVILIASISYLTAGGIILLLGLSWVRDDRVPSVRVLGSGNRLSVLVVSDEARLLIAAGNDASAFSNALAAALHPMSRRIDVVLLSAEDSDRAVVARVRRDYPEAVTFMLPGDLNHSVQDLGLTDANILDRSTRYSLPGGVTVTVDPGDDDTGWSAEIQTDHAFIHVTKTPDAGSVSKETPTAIVYTEKVDSELQLPIEAQVFVMPGSSETPVISPEALESSDKQHWLVRVFDTGVEQLTFTDRGIALPSSAVLFEPAEPQSSHLLPGMDASEFTLVRDHIGDKTPHPGSVAHHMKHNAVCHLMVG